MFFSKYISFLKTLEGVYLFVSKTSAFNIVYYTIVVVNFFIWIKMWGYFVVKCNKEKGADLWHKFVVCVKKIVL